VERDLRDAAPLVLGLVPGPAMRSQLATREKKIVAVALLSVSVSALALNYWFGPAGLLFVLIATACLAIVLQVELYRRVSESVMAQQEQICQTQAQNYRQIESLFSVFGIIHPNAPLPPMRDWAVSPDFLSLMIGLLRESKPRLVVELGSGVSTLVAGYVQKEWGGKILSFDHSEQFAALSKIELCKHGLDDVVSVLWAPLKEVTLQGRAYLWYETTELQQCGPVDFLIVDGPPGELQKMSRYPALPLLRNELSANAIILLDDAGRSDEKKIVDLWRMEISDLEYEYVATEKGAVILRRGGRHRRAELTNASGSSLRS
jgi:predicted O-methyltransferase YrrM